MKRLVAVFLTLIIFAGAFACPVYAENSETALQTNEIIISQSVEYFDDGSYAVTTISQPEIALAASGTKVGYKSVDYFNSDDVKQWTATIHSKFTYTGTAATAYSQYTSYTIYNSAWKLKAESSSASGSKATGNFTFKYYLLGVPVKTQDVSVTISCSPTGVLS